MASNTVLGIKLCTYGLLVTQGDFFDRDFNALPGRIPRAGDEFVTSALLPKRDAGRDLSTGVSESRRRSEDDARRARENRQPHR